MLLHVNEKGKDTTKYVIIKAFCYLINVPSKIKYSKRSLQLLLMNQMITTWCYKYITEFMPCVL